METSTARPTKRPKAEDGEHEAPVLDDAEEEEALRFARIAKMAEAKARGGSAPEPEDIKERLSKLSQSIKEEATAKPTFLTKAERQAAALARLEERRQESQRGEQSVREPAAASKDKDREREREMARAREADRERERSREAGRSAAAVPDRARDKELEAIRDQYLGKRVKKKMVVKPSEKFSKIFQFDWEATDDTSQDLNPVYSQRLSINPLFGRGYVAGIDLQEQRKTNQFNKTLVEKRQTEERQAELQDGSFTQSEIRDRERARRRVAVLRYVSTLPLFLFCLW